jgi:hypothetical protein
MGIECCGPANDEFEDEENHTLTDIEKQKLALKAIADIKETGGQEGPEPTRYGDWEFKGRVSDF